METPLTDPALWHRCQCLANERARILGEAGPVGPELKFHRNASYDSDREIETKDSGPERPPDCTFHLRFLGRAISSRPGTKPVPW